MSTVKAISRKLSFLYYRWRNFFFFFLVVWREGAVGIYQDFAFVA